MDTKEDNGPAALEKKMEIYLKFFREADTDGDGEISIQDLARALWRRKCFVHESKIAHIFVAIDKKRDWVIDLDEFIEEMSKEDRNIKKENEWRIEFDSIDTDRDGFISRTELMDFINRVNPKRVKDIDDIMNNVDRDRDGKISHWEFAKDMNKTYMLI